MQISESGKYVLHDDIHGEDVELDGHGFTIYGWIHANKGNVINIHNLVIRPPINIYIENNEFCPVCKERLHKHDESINIKSESLVLIHSRKTVVFDSRHLISAKNNIEQVAIF